ncbi:hypothetical protein EYF80_009012 [Liparis tanakae]|uniref:Uncharacterized protein n=1 Tax=Liparis tanakae TaxID=230148 RepID=A0A4Z2IT52_9TELE|nr:hypothetical protein EYF80_009012 [Liparis tanakae]
MSASGVKVGLFSSSEDQQADRISCGDERRIAVVWILQRECPSRALHMLSDRLTVTSLPRLASASTFFTPTLLPTSQILVSAGRRRMATSPCQRPLCTLPQCPWTTTESNVSAGMDTDVAIVDTVLADLTTDGAPPAADGPTAAYGSRQLFQAVLIARISGKAVIAAVLCLHLTPNIMLLRHTWHVWESQDLVENLQREN